MTYKEYKKLYRSRPLGRGMVIRLAVLSVLVGWKTYGRVGLLAVWFLFLAAVFVLVIGIIVVLGGGARQ